MFNRQSFHVKQAFETSYRDKVKQASLMYVTAGSFSKIYISIDIFVFFDAVKCISRYGTRELFPAHWHTANQITPRVIGLP